MVGGDPSCLVILGYTSAFFIPLLAPWVAAFFWKPRLKWRAVARCSVLAAACYAAVKLAFLSLAFGRPLPPNQQLLVALMCFVVGLLAAASQHAAFNQPRKPFKSAYTTEDLDLGNEDAGDRDSPDDLALDQAIHEMLTALDELCLRDQAYSLTPRDIHRAWRRKAAKCHPDSGGDAAEFRRITEARDFLLGVVA